jgi:hypothetical protein
MRYLIAFIAPFLFFYAFGAFITWEPNPQHWHAAYRFALAFCGTTFGILAMIGAGMLDAYEGK